MNVMKAATEGDMETVKQWLTAPHTRHYRQVVQVLTQAVEHGHDNMCQLMLDSGQVFDNAISLALLTACRYNRQSTAQLLVRHGHINTHNLTEALLAACVSGQVSIVTWLTSNIMQLSQSDRIKWLLTTACARGDLSVVKQLATQVDSDVTHVMSQAIRVACYRGRDGVVKWLISNTTVDVSSRGVLNEVRGEMTSLMVACKMDRNDIVRRLLQCVTPHTVNMMSGTVANTALHFTICCEPDKHCKMPLACTDSDIAKVTATLYLSNVNLQVSDDSTALHLACIRGDVEIVRMLLSAFADTHITDDDRRTPAMLAELHGHTEVLPYLRCTLSNSPGILEHVSNTNNIVSISLVSIENATQHNTPHTNSSRPGTSTSTSNTSKSTKRANMRVV